MSVRKWPAASTRSGTVRGRQDRLALHQHQMQPDAQARHGLGARHRIGSGGARHHQAGGGENAVAMGPLDRFVDFDGSAEIVGGDDEVFQITLPLREGRNLRAQRSKFRGGVRRKYLSMTPPRKMLRIFRPSLKGRVDPICAVSSQTTGLRNDHVFAVAAGTGRTPRLRAGGAPACRARSASRRRSRRSWRGGNRTSCRSPPPTRRSRCGRDADSSAARSGCRHRSADRHRRRTSHSPWPACRGRCRDRARPATPGWCAD